MELRQKLILASGSPRRVDLLKQAGIEPARLMPMDLDETPQRSEHPRSLARRMVVRPDGGVPTGDVSMAWDKVIPPDLNR